MIILKLGGSIITRKDKTKPTLNPANLERIAQEISVAKIKKLIIIHGAGSFGHPYAQKYGIGSVIKNDRELGRKKRLCPNPEFSKKPQPFRLPLPPKMGHTSHYCASILFHQKQQ